MNSKSIAPIKVWYCQFLWNQQRVFSCPSSSRPTLVTHSLTHWLLPFIVMDSKPPSLPDQTDKPKSCKTYGGHEETWSDQQKHNDKDKCKDKDNDNYI